MYIAGTVIGGQGSGMEYLRWIPGCVLLLATGVAGPAVAGAGAGDWQPEAHGWEFVRKVDRIGLYRKPVTGSPFPALLAHTRMPVPAADVYRVISDYDHFAEFVPAVSMSRVLERSATHTRVYQRLDLPMLFTDRHYIIQVTDRFDATNGLTRVNWQLAANQSRALPPGTAVLPKVFSGFWRLTDTPDGSGCEALYSIHVDPGGRLPAWLFTRAAKRYITDVVTAVRQRAMRITE